MKIKNDLLIRAAKGEQVERTPVWLMRQAGRILPQYRKIRERVAGFKTMVETPELACEVTIQPVDELGVDAAIIFSDILVVPEAMGLPYEVVEAKGPFFKKAIQNSKDIANLKIVQPEEGLPYVLKAVKLVKKELNGRIPLIGFAGAPWTIFAYMVEGHGSKTFAKARKLLYTQPRLAHSLLEKITASTIHYLKAQIAAGVDVVQVFDSWAGILNPQQYREFSLNYISMICDALQVDEGSKGAPAIVFPKGAFFSREDLGKLRCHVIGLDWNMDIAESRRLIGPSKALQGNADPCLLYAETDTIRQQTIEMLKKFGPRQHIANLGHGVYPDTPLDHVKCFVNTVKEYQWR